MRRNASRASSPRRQRGISLVESLVAFAVVAAGTAAAAQLQSRLHLAGDVARQRSEAVRLGAATIEEMRSFVAVDGGAGERTYAGIASGEWSLDAASSPSARGSYRIERRIDDAGFSAAKSARVAVRWTDRGGGDHKVVLDSIIAAVAPAYSGSLALGTGAIAAASRGASGRAPGLPLTARNLGDGRSAWKPAERGATALVFDNRSGEVVARCDDVAPIVGTDGLSASLLAGARCTAGRWLLAAGTIRFSSATPPSAVAADDTPPPTSVSLALRDGVYPARPACFSEARKAVRYLADGGLQIRDVPVDSSAAGAAVPGSSAADGDRFIAWHCIVAPRPDGRWSGRIDLVGEGWAIGSGPAERRVCRYVGGVSDANDANIATAGVDSDIGAALIGRNFLVVRGSETCPAEPRSARTEPHQP